MEVIEASRSIEKIWLFVVVVCIMCALATPYYLLILYPLVMTTFCPRLVLPGSPPDLRPPPIAEAWPVEAQEVELPMTTRTPPISPPRALRHSLSTVDHGCGGAICAGRREARNVPRLEGLPDHAIRAFVTKCVAFVSSVPQALLVFCYVCYYRLGKLVPLWAISEITIILRNMCYFVLYVVLFLFAREGCCGMSTLAV